MRYRDIQVVHMQSRNGNIILQQWLIPLIYALQIAGYPLISPISIIFGLDNNRLIAIPFRVVLFFTSILVIFFAVRREKVYKGFVLFPIILFWSLYLVRLISDTLLFPIPLSMEIHEYYSFIIGVSFIPMLAFLVRSDDVALRRAIMLSIHTASIALILIYFGLRKSVLFGELETISYRLSIETLNPISMGYLGTSLSILGIFMLFTNSGLKRIYFGFIVIVGLFVAGLAASKGPLISFICAVTPFLLLKRNNGNRINMIAALAVIILISFYSYMFIQETLGFNVISRFIEIGSDAGSTERLTLMQNAWEQFETSPIFGSGLEELENGIYPHNVVIESFMATGLLGGMVYCLLLIFSFIAAIRLIKERPEAGWVSMMYIQSLVGSMFSGSLMNGSSFWCFIAAVVALSSWHELIPIFPRIFKSSFHTK